MWLLPAPSYGLPSPHPTLPGPSKGQAVPPTPSTLPPLSSPAEHRYGSCHACQCITCGPAGHSVPSPEHIAAGSILLLQPSMPTSLAAHCYPTLPTSSVPLTPITSTSSLLGTRNSSLPFPSPHLSPSCLVNASLWPLGPPCLPTVPDLLLLHWKLPS